MALVRGEVDRHLPAGGEERGETRPEVLVPLDEVERGVGEDEVEGGVRSEVLDRSLSNRSPGAGEGGALLQHLRRPVEPQRLPAAEPLVQLPGQLPRAAAEVDRAHSGPGLDEVEEIEEGSAPLAQELRVLAGIPRVGNHVPDRSGRRTIGVPVSAAKKRLLLYGANGYTGRLILDAALARGLPVTIAGRRPEAVEPMANERGVPFETFALDEAPRRLAERFSRFGAVLLAAGPFSRTSAPVVAACLKARVPYLDITGEIGVFEAVFARHAEAVKAGVVLLPGVGFDVVPSDCLAASLALALPGAVRLQLAFRGFGISSGTARTMLEGLPKGGAARIDGKLVSVPVAWKARTIPSPTGPGTP